MSTDAPRHADGRGDGDSPRYPDQPVEFWPTAAIRLAVCDGDVAEWQRIVTAIKRDPYGRTARQVEEVLGAVESRGVSPALEEVLTRTRHQLDADERAEVAELVRTLIERSGLGQAEFASRIGVSGRRLGEYACGAAGPPASLMIRMRRLSDRFARMRRARDGA